MNVERFEQPPAYKVQSKAISCGPVIGSEPSVGCALTATEGVEHGKQAMVEDFVEKKTNDWGSSRIDEISDQHCASELSDSPPDHKALLLLTENSAKNGERTGSGISLWGTQSEPLSWRSLMSRSSMDMDTLRGEFFSSSGVERTSSMSAIQLKRLLSKVLSVF